MFETTGVDHITLIGSTREDTIAFYQGILGMELVLEQPNLDAPDQTHLFFDPGDGRLITFFVSDSQPTDPRPVPLGIGSVHHIAFSVSEAVFERALKGLSAAGILHSGKVDRGVFYSLYFRDHNGLTLELSLPKVQLPAGVERGELYKTAARLRAERGDHHLLAEHLAAALAELSEALSA